jgi:hypothetical protein
LTGRMMLFYDSVEPKLDRAVPRNAAESAVGRVAP